MFWDAKRTSAAVFALSNRRISISSGVVFDGSISLGIILSASWNLSLALVPVLFVSRIEDPLEPVVDVFDGPASVRAPLIARLPVAVSG